MIIKFIGSQIPANYSQPTSAPQLKQSQQYKGKTYSLLGISKRTYSLQERRWLAVKAFAKTFFSLGLALFLKSTRQEWRSYWTGKGKVALYSHSNLLVTKTLANQGKL